MPGTATNFNANQIAIGPGKAWLNVAVPGTGARLTLHTDGTPESVANPNAKHLGLTEAGTTMKIGNNIESFEADELTAPYRQQLTGDEATISGNMLQTENTELVEKMLPGGTRTTGAGYEQVTFGGKITITGFSVAVIAPTAADATKYAVFQLYNCINFGGLEYTLSRKTPSSSPFEFQGQSVSTRVEGDQVGSYWKQV